MNFRLTIPVRIARESSSFDHSHRSAKHRFGGFSAGQKDFRARAAPLIHSNGEKEARLQSASHRSVMAITWYRERSCGRVEMDPGGQSLAPSRLPFIVKTQIRAWQLALPYRSLTALGVSLMKTPDR
jgi:hypothetical protein